MHHELVLIDQSQLRQRQRELHACHEQSLTRLPLELLNGLPQIPAHELRVPIDPVQGARHDVFLCRVDRPGEGFHPIRPRSRPRRRPPRCLHHFVSHPAKAQWSSDGCTATSPGGNAKTSQPPPTSTFRYFKMSRKNLRSASASLL